ncbi:PAS domain S-box protein [Methanolobus vulcani]|uniref:histidine kinase n=1 Tax=Methanolobus vulcani TaxID=38026 RepID=A0A7Z8P1B4_9EURY|nr:CHASE4 domain-containing protein [Methanolobus vulcani]TQD23422.1 PAS domain S-box protein [Methanolobus vulcani]
MKIYRKTAITLGIVFVFLFLLTASVNQYVFLTHTEGMENNVLNDNTLRVQRAFENEISHMDSTACDWAAWDETYEYMINNNSDYIISNLDDIETFLTLDINFILYFDTDGNLVYGKACDLENEIQVPLSEEIITAFPKDSVLINHPSIDSTVSGIMMIGNSPTIIASRPIIKGDYSGPIHGTLIIGRFLDESFIEPMEEQILLPIEMYALSNQDMPYDFVDIEDKLLGEKYVTSIDNDKNKVAGYFLLEDVYGEPVVIARTEMPRLIYNEGLTAISVTSYLTLLISLLFAILLSFLLKKNLLSRITSLQNGINEIDFKGDINSKIEMKGNDELSELADNINSMLDSLQEKTIMLQSTIESISYGLVAFDKNAKVLFMNPEYRNIFALASETGPGADGEILLNEVLKLAENPAVMENEVHENHASTGINKFRLKLKDGRTIQTYSLPLIVNNEIYGRIYAHNDITEILLQEKELREEISRREDAEEKLKLSEEKFSKIATSANDAIIMLNNEGKTIFWNEAATKMFGYSEEEIIDKDMHSFIAPDKYIDGYKAGFEIFTKTGHGDVIGNTIELEGKRKDETEFPIELSLSSIQLSDGSWNAVAIIRDVTERKKLDEIEHEILERLTIIINNINSGILLIDNTNKTIADVNPVAAKMIGLPKEKIIGNVCHKFVCTKLEDQCPIIDLKQKVDKSESVLLDKNGNEIPVIKSVVSVKLQGKEYLVESFYDISQRKKVEEALIKAKMAAEASDMAKSEFLTNMSHELRTPLNSIIGFSDMLLHIRQHELDQKQTRYLNNISNSGKHLLDVINDILDISKIEAGRMDLSIEETDVVKIMDEIRKNVSSLVEQKELTLEFNIAEDVATINTDKLKFKQILYNLIGNAIKFTREGGSIKISAKRVLNMIEVEIKDTGIGISEQDQKDLFEPFRQVDSALSRNYQGSGLGLAIVKKYLEMQKGSIRVESEPEAGSSFIFELPL